jgi:hypothetical protein
VNIEKNNWWDESLCEGGSLIDLIMKMFSTDVAGAIAILEKPGNAKTSFSFSDEQKENSHGIEIINIQPLQKWSLKQYVIERNIDLSIAKRYIQEVQYKAYEGQKEPFYALAFKNNKGGYEIRSKPFKGGNNPKYFTTIPGYPKRLNIFEGFCDYLSALTHYKQRKFINLTVILNSTGNTSYIESIVKSVDLVNCFLDNDESGEKALQKIQRWNPNTVNQAAKIYPGYNDFNDFICKKLKE